MHLQKKKMGIFLLFFLLLLLVCLCLIVNICSCLCAYIFMHVHACGSQRLAWVSLTVSAAKFTDSGRSADQKSQGSSCVFFASARIIGIYFSWILGIKLRSQCLHGEYLTCWTNSPALLNASFPKSQNRLILTGLIKMRIKMNLSN